CREVAKVASTIPFDPRACREVAKTTSTMTLRPLDKLEDRECVLYDEKSFSLSFCLVKRAKTGAKRAEKNEMNKFKTVSKINHCLIRKTGTVGGKLPF
ncbi:MAG: hypothetical protein RSA67_07275, partial [Alistipes sp.]